MAIFLSKNDTPPYEYITEFEYPKEVVINKPTSNETDNNTYPDKFEYRNFCYLIVENETDNSNLEHLRLKVESEEQNLGVSFYICLTNEDGLPDNNWKKVIDLYNVPNNSKIKIWYKWEILNNLFLTKTGDYVVELNVYKVVEES